MALSHMNFSGNNETQQRHVGYNNSSGNYRQNPRNINEIIAKEKSHHANRPKIFSLKGKTWNIFSDYYGCESSDDESDGDTTDDDPLITATLKKRHQKGFVVKLKNKDRALYGTCPETDPFQIVTCRNCRMVLKPSALKSHLERHEKERKHESHSSELVTLKHERLEKAAASSTADKTSSVTEKLDKISVMVDKYEKPSSHTLSSANFGNVIVEKSLEKLGDVKRHRNFMKKPSTISESSADSVHYETLTSALESTRNSPIQRRRKRKYADIEYASTTFQNVTSITSSSPQQQTNACRTIIVDQSDLMNVIRDTSSPPPLAPITAFSANTKPNDQQTSVVLQITKLLPTAVTATVIDGSFVMQPLEQEETEIDLKDLKILKPLVKDQSTPTETQTLLTSSNFFATQPRPLAMNTFNLKKLNAQSYVMATQRKLVEFGRNLKTEEKVVGGKITTPKTWSFIERSQVFIPFRVTH